MASNRIGMGGAWVGSDVVLQHLRAGGRFTVQECEPQNELFGGTSRMFVLSARGISVTVSEGELSTLCAQWPGRFRKPYAESQTRMF